MKKFIVFILIIFIMCGCSKDKKEIDERDEMLNTIDINIDGNDYILRLEKNDTAKEFINILPKNFKMKELNGNEKYIYLENSFTVNPKKVKKIESGDVMLFGDDCLVIFYKSFDTSYSYTKIGHIDNLIDLGSNDSEVIIKRKGE